MTWAAIALAVLGFCAVASALVGWSRAGSLAIGLGGGGLAAVLCVIGGTAVLARAPHGGMSVDWAMPLGAVRLAVDALSAWFLLVIGLVSLSVCIYSWNYFDDESAHGPVGAYAPLLCTLMGAMVLVVCAGDVVLFLVGWELMALSAFFLIGFRDRDTEARKGAWTYLIATHLGTMLGVLPVFAAFVGRSGSTSMGSFAGAFSSAEAAPCVALFSLGVVGFGTKSGLMPFHVWLPAAHPVAPSPVSALLSGMVIKTGIYGLLRLLSWLPELPVGCAVGLILVSIITGIMGILYALGQRQVKRMLAYSSVENIGIIGLAVSLGLLGRSLHQPALVALGLGGALLHVFNHALFKGLLFLSAGAVLHGAGTGDADRLGGLARHAPLNAAAFLMGSLAICALPPLNGFVSEFAIYAGLLGGAIRLPGSYSALLACCAAALALIGGLALLVFSKTFSVIFLGTQRDPGLRWHSIPRSMHAGMGLLALGCVAAGLFSGPLAQAASLALAPFATSAPLDERALREPLAMIGGFFPAFAVLIVVAAVLFVVRQRVTAGQLVGGSGGTWGCGFAFPKASMQYTGSSYSWTMMQVFRHAVRPQRTFPVLAGPFPHPGSVATVTPDVAQERIYQPLFHGLARLFERLWPLQHGRIQLYLVYIVVTLFAVFFIEAWSGGGFGRQHAAASAARRVGAAVPELRAESHAGRGGVEP